MVAISPNGSRLVYPSDRGITVRSRDRLAGGLRFLAATPTDPWARAILKARHRRLRRQRLAVHRMPIEQQLLDRIVGEAIAVIRIGIATGNPEHPLRHEIAERMRHTIGVTRVGQAAAQSRRQLQTLIGGTQQDRAAVGTGVRLVERSDERLGDEVRKENSLCYRVVVQRQRLRVDKGSSASPLYHSGAFLFLPNHGHS